jgi:Mg2+/Co2+ transporter CorB
MKNYELNFNVKQLLLICEYYVLLKDVKMNKMKKQDIIEQIILYENNTDNIEMVIKRKELWYYMSELKNDKIMKRFVIW